MEPKLIREATVNDNFFIISHGAEKLLMDEINSWEDNTPGLCGFFIEAPKSFNKEADLTPWNYDEIAKFLLKNISKHLSKCLELKVFLMHDYSTVIITKGLGGAPTDQLSRQFVEDIYGIKEDNLTTFYDFTVAKNNFLDRINVALQKSLAPTQKKEQKNSPTSVNLEISEKRFPGFQDRVQLRQNRAELKLLVVEDDLSSARIIKRVLEKYDRSVAYNAEEAIISYGHNLPDIVFLDIGLPDASGMEVLKAICNADPNAFVVMLTSNSSHSNLKAAISNGAKGFMVKPFTLSKIESYIEKKNKELRNQDLACFF